MSSMLFPTDMERTARLSDEAEPLYRYELGRRWADGGKVVNFVMLNPSVADGLQDDPTIRRCIGFAKAWGFHALVVTNLFALRSTDRKALKTAADPVGPLDDCAILNAASRASQIVCAWGEWGSLRGRSGAVLGLLKANGLTPYYLRLTTGGEPVHPLYLPGNLRPIAMGGPAR